MNKPESFVLEVINRDPQQGGGWVSEDVLQITSRSSPWMSIQLACLRTIIIYIQDLRTATHGYTSKLVIISAA